MCLVIAFAALRDILKKMDKNVGPIVTLSYKNHALDEFLLDVLKSGPRELRERTGKLIRLGKPEQEGLTNYTERSSAKESHAHRELEKRLQVMKDAKIFIQQMSQCTSISGTINYELLVKALGYCAKYNALVPHTCNTQTAQSSFDTLKDLIYSELSIQSSSIKLLVSESEHWALSTDQKQKGLTRPEQLLKLWFEGKSPPPRCAFQGVYADESFRCPSCATNGSPYCVNHRCDQYGCLAPRAKNQNPFCEDHSCRFGECQLANSGCGEYCVLHSCPICIDLPRDGDHACAKHHCVTPECDQAQLFPFPFCLQHCCKVCVDLKQITVNSKTTITASGKCSEFCIEHACHFPGFGGCPKARQQTNKFCEEHACRICGNSIDSSSYDAMFSGLCIHHRCGHEDELCNNVRCCNVKDGEPSEFCRDHSCIACVELDLPLRSPVLPPRFTCAKHLLCDAINEDGTECMALLADSCISGMCTIHESKEELASTQCTGITKKGNRCRSVPLLGQLFCDAHKDQAKPKVLDASQAKGRVLRGDTRDNLLRDIEPLPLEYTGNSADINVLKGGDKFQHVVCSAKDCCVRGITCVNSSWESWQCPFHKRLSDLKNNVLTAVTTAASGADMLSIPTLVAGHAKDAVAAAVEDIKVTSGAGAGAGASFDHIRYKMAKKKNVDDDYDIIHEAADWDGVDDSATAQNIDEMPMTLLDSVAADELDTGPTAGDESASELEIETETEQRQHFLDIGGRDDEDDDEDGNTNLMALPNHTAVDSPRSALDKCALKWSWQSDANCRQEQVEELVESVSAAAVSLVAHAELYIEEARRNKQEANAMTLKNATVIGGTIVGAARRLYALRAAEPFAIIVEEACEVMEPTLIAVLAVESLQKLELIGDHQQLPAFVQQCWYNLEMKMKTIKKSLFERIVESQPEYCTVLDQQRRMRPCISSLTSGEYLKTVKILDHPCTITQCIGDKASAGAVKEAKALWSGKGRTVPGVRSCIYFWNMAGNTQSKPKAGLSACNENEAHAVLGLAKFLVLCGVPPQSITVITPYQGQKRELIGLMRKERTTVTSINISTIDRYQGDENDVVILSLVRTNPGNRFVTLPNRFIVGASRARLGFFVIGSASAVVDSLEPIVKGPVPHWNTFMTKLKSPDDSPSNDDTFDGARVGESLPVCCPQHADSVHSVPSLKTQMKFPCSSDWPKFCSLPCAATLNCGHPCDLPCHVPRLNEHNPRCNVQLQRPCEKHKEVPLFCHELQLCKGQTLDQGLDIFKCSVKETYQLPGCEHEVPLECHRHSSILQGENQWPECSVPVEDYFHPRCGHSYSNLTCAQRRKYEAKAPICNIEVTENLICGHKKQMQCHMKGDPSTYPPCRKDCNINRPRCGHTLSLRCFESTRLLTEWEQKAYHSACANPKTAVLQLRTGQNYGPSEKQIMPLMKAIDNCQVIIEFERPCEHKLQLPCEQGFEVASGKNILPPCKELVSIICVLCGGDALIPCHLHERFEELRTCEQYLLKTANNWLLEEDIARLASSEQHTELWDLLRFVKCSANTRISRKCDPSHLISFSCSDLLSVIRGEKSLPPRCKISIRRHLKCGHDIDVPCSDRAKMPPPICKKRAEVPFKFSGCGHQVHVDSCGELQCMLMDKTLTCKRKVDTQLVRCKHSVEMECCNAALAGQQGSAGEVLLPHPAMDNERSIVHESALYCTPCAGTPECLTEVNFSRTCGHVLQSVKCHDAFLWAEKTEEPPKCLLPVEYEHPVCSHQLSTHCYVVAVLNDWKPWGIDQMRPRPENILVGGSMHEKQYYRYPLEFIPQALQHTDIIAPHLYVCKETTNILFNDCGHSAQLNCRDLFTPTKEAREIQCKHEELVSCQRQGCGGTHRMACHLFRTLTPEEIANKCTNMIPTLCSICCINKRPARCGSSHTECVSDVTVTLLCGHQATWRCGRDLDPRGFHDADSQINAQCLLCVKRMWEIDREIVVTYDQLQAAARSMVDKTMNDPNLSIEVESLDLHGQFNDHYDPLGRIQSIGRLLKAFDERLLPLFLPPRATREDYIQENYDLVFLDLAPGKPVDKNNMRNRFAIKETMFGKGLKMKLFTKRSVERLASLDGDITMWVALAFKGNLYNAANPEAPLAAFLPLNARSNDKPLQAAAEKTKQDFIRRGYSGVNISGGAGAEDGEPNDSQLIYWQTPAVVPTSITKLKLSAACLLCQEFCFKESNKGAICDNGHFICWGEDCFPAYIDSAAAPGAQEGMVDASGKMLCPWPGCKVPFEPSQILVNAPAEIITKLLNFNVNFRVQQETGLVRQELEDKMKKELEEVRKMDEISREVLHFRKKIEEDILIMRCPRCRQAFNDFDGCFALTCSNNHCHAGFCAWCLKDCNGDAHAHVVHCEKGNNNVFGNRKELQKVWDRTRRLNIIDLLRGKNAQIVKRVFDLLEPTFTELNITVENLH